MVAALVMAVVAAIIFLLGVTVGVFCEISRRTWSGRLSVEVGEATDAGKKIQHQVSARIVDQKGRALHFKRVDMNEEDWELRLGEAVAEMKSKLRTLEAVERITEER
jgi:hypothetical protein